MGKRLTLDEFLRDAESGPYETWRRGQAFFHNLYGVRPDLAERIRMTALDPYHDDALIPAAVAWLREHWGDDGR